MRQKSAWALGRLEVAAGRESVAALVKLLEDPDPVMRRTSAGALGDIGRPTAQPAVDMLLKAFRGDSDPSVKRAVLAALVNVVGPETKKAAAELTTALKQMRENKDVDIVELRDVAFALANIGGRDALPAVPVLTEGLSDADPAQRQQSSAALGNIGESAADAVPKLAEVLNNDKDADVRRNAALALGRIGPKAMSAVPNLIKALDPSEPDEVRRYAVEAIAYVGQDAAERACKDLIRIIKEDKAWRVRQAPYGAERCSGS